MVDVERAVSLLRGLGWLVTPPPAEKPPEPVVGQTWVSPKPGVKARTIVAIGPHRWWHDEPCVSFTRAGEEGVHPNVLRPSAWRAWVAKSDARPGESQ